MHHARRLSGTDEIGTLRAIRISLTTKPFPHVKFLLSVPTVLGILIYYLLQSKIPVLSFMSLHVAYT